MKQNGLILGNVVKGYKGEKEFVITQINEETVILDNEKEVKISTLLKNYKLVKDEPLAFTVSRFTQLLKSIALTKFIQFSTFK